MTEQSKKVYEVSDIQNMLGMSRTKTYKFIFKNMSYFIDSNVSFCHSTSVFTYPTHNYLTSLYSPTSNPVSVESRDQFSGNTFLPSNE